MNVTVWATLWHCTWSHHNSISLSSKFFVPSIWGTELSICANTKSQSNITIFVICIVMQHKLGCHLHYLYPCQCKIKYHSFLLYSTTSACCMMLMRNIPTFVIHTCKNTSTAITKIYTVLCCRLSCIWWWPHDKMVAECIFLLYSPL